MAHTPRKASEVADYYEATASIVEALAEASTARLRPMGFSFSAKMLLADVNDTLEKKGLPPLNLTRIKLILTKLGYEAEGLAWVPMVGTKYSAWTKPPERCSYDGLSGYGYANLEGILAEHDNYFSSKSAATAYAEKHGGDVRCIDVDVQHQDSVDRDFTEITVPVWEVIHQCTHTPNGKDD